MASPQTNGETKASDSAFFGHLSSYPFVADSIAIFKSNPYGAKSIDLTTASYEKLGKPLIPYLAKPYQFVSPYVTKVDSIGDSTLTTIENKFPVVLAPTGELVDTGKSYVFFPLKKGTEGKEYVFGVYNAEIKKVGGEGMVTYGKAAISTGLIVGSDTLSWLGSFLAQKKQQAKEVSSEKTGN